MINYITYAGKSLRDFNLYINGSGTYDSPAKVYNMIKIPGRTGDIAYDEKRFENIDITYPTAFINPTFGTNFEGLRAFLYSKSGYQRLEDTYHPNEFRMALYKDDLEVKMDMLNMFGTFDLVFHCKPQRFLKSGETAVTVNTSEGSITNPTLYESKPLLHVYGYGVLGIGNKTITIANPASSDIYIDCDLMDAYKLISGVRMSVNDKITLSDYNFPGLAPGDNGITLGTGITSVEITPRWWTI